MKNIQYLKNTQYFGYIPTKQNKFFVDGYQIFT